MDVIGSESRRILILPSWFPIRGDQRGEYFSDQVKLISAHHDVSVLYLKTNEISFTQIFKSFLTGKLSCLVPQNITYLLDSNINSLAYYCPDYTFLPATFRLYLIKIFFLLKIKKHYQNEEFNLVMGLSSFGCGMFTDIVSNQLNCPAVIIEHQVFNLSYYNKIYSNRIIDCLFKVKELYAVSNHLRRLMHSQYITRPIKLFPNLVVNDFFDMKIEEYTTDFSFVYVSYSEPIKGNDMFYSFLKNRDCTQVPKINIYMIGKYSEYDTTRFEDLNSDYCTIFFLGELSKKDISTCFTKSKAIISTSYAETFGLAIREAFAVGLPVICTKSGGVDVDVNLLTGILIEDFNQSQFDDAINTICLPVLPFKPSYISNYCMERYSSYAYSDEIDQMLSRVTNG